MPLPFLNKKISQIIMSKKAPDVEVEVSADLSPEEEAVMGELINAIKSGDKKGLMEALSAALELIHGGHDDSDEGDME